MIFRTTALLGLTICLFASCNDMLNKEPRDTFINNKEFWSSSNSVESYTNKFYDNYVGYNQNGNFGWFYFKTLSDDQAYSGFENWTFTTVPSTSTYWTEGFREVRRANYVIQNVATSTLSTDEKSYYTAIARLNRAWAYYQLVREYGNVEWLNEVITSPDDPHVYGERTDRDVVMDSVLLDLNYAAEHLPIVTDKTKWSKHMALAMKGDVCLYEGTFAKYRTTEDNGKGPNTERAVRYLQNAAEATDALINSQNYSLTPQYGEVYNSVSLGSGSETIFYRNYEKDLVMHSLIAWTCSSSEQYGITKDAFDAFLFADGKPLSTTSLNKDDRATLNAQEDYSISAPLSVRDKRLSILIDSIISFKGHGWIRVDQTGKGTGDPMTSSTGYTIRKYDNLSLAKYYRINTTTGYTDAPLYWYAVVLLNNAEAKAELGTISQTDLDRTVNLLLHRAGLPSMDLHPTADPANNMNVSDLLWEIRRCRRCELMTDNWYRYWDLVRWHQLDKLDNSKYTNISLGANLSNVKEPEVTINAANYIVVYNQIRRYDPKYYLFPVPTNELNLNKNVRQNPGW